MRARVIVALMALLIVLSYGDEAEAFNTCNEACAVIAYALITGGGLTTAAGSQISLLEGEPDSNWGYVSLGFAGANAATSGVLLIVAGVMAATDDDDDAAVFAVWGGIQMTIAIAGLVSGAHAVANSEPAPGAIPRARPAGATITIPF